MSNIPPPTPVEPLNYSMAPVPRSTSGAAVASLVLGILGCVPILTGIPAAILGFIGIRQTRDPLVRGRGMAVAGLVLGLINLCAWSLIAIFVGVLFKGSAAPRQVAHDFLNDLSTSQVVSANNLTATTLSPTQFSYLLANVSSYGPLISSTNSSINLNDNNGQSTCVLSGTATFNGPSPTHPYTINLVKESGVWKVASCTITP